MKLRLPLWILSHVNFCGICRPNVTIITLFKKLYENTRKINYYGWVVAKNFHSYYQSGQCFCSLLSPPKFKLSFPWFSRWMKNFFKGVLHLWALFLKTLCIFSKNKATLDKVSYGSGQKYSKELKNHSFTSVEAIVVKLQWKMCENQYFPCFEP